MDLEVTELIVANVEANLLWEEPAAVADRLEPALRAAWERETRAVIERAFTIARAGGPATIGVNETLDALVQARVSHLLLDPTRIHGPASVGPSAKSVIGEVSGDLVAERAVELAIASAADVSSAPAGDGALAAAGGILAMLRF